MARTKIAKHAWEEGTFIITLTYLDDDEAAVTPNAVTWTLTDSKGTVINSREDVEIETPGTTNDIVLSGADLALKSGEEGTTKRVLYIQGNYDSDAGAGLPLKGEAEFIIDDILAET